MLYITNAITVRVTRKAWKTKLLQRTIFDQPELKESALETSLSVATLISLRQFCVIRETPAAVLDRIYLFSAGEKAQHVGGYYGVF